MGEAVNVLPGRRIMERNTNVPAPGKGDYEPPLVEEVMDADDLTREAHYAGSPGSPTIG